MSYLSLIQKDLPLATWGLNEAPSSSAASDRFINQNGAYSTAQTSKAVPIVFGSSRSIILSANSGGYALSLPTLDRLSEKAKDEPFSIEFWIKFIDPSFSAPTAPTKIMGKEGSSYTGIYLHNSSIVAMVGDSVSTGVVITAVCVPNIRKPLHIVMSYLNGSLTLYVNGQSSSASSSDNLISNSYNSSNEYFRFIAQTGNLKYAIDCIAYYNRVLDVQTVRRHLAYGLGYEISSQIPASFGGIRYNLSMSDTKPVSVIDRGWENPKAINNMSVKDGYLTINNVSQPKLLFANDKTYPFVWQTEGLSTAEGGYVLIENPLVISNGLEHGFGFSFYKPSSITGEQTLVYIDNPYDSERFLRFYFDGNALKYQIDGNTPVTLTATVSNATTITFGYYYSVANQQISVFNNQSTLNTTSNSTFYPGSIRLMSSPTFTDKEPYQTDSVTSAYLREVVHLVNTSSNILTAINNYCATFNSTDRRFVMSAQGSYEFDLDLKRLASTNSTVGNHRVEWGYDGAELSVLATGNPSAWKSETAITNRSPIPWLIDESPGTNKYLSVKINVTANDVEFNQPKVYYFRVVTYDTTLDSTYRTTILADGPDIDIYSDETYFCSLPAREETPFLYNEEQGGLYVGRRAVITYDYASIDNSSDNSGISSMSFFINVASSTRRLLTLTDGTTTYNITYDGTSITGLTGAASFVNGASTAVLPSGTWNHVILKFNTKLNSPVTITIGSTSPSTNPANFYIDEMMFMGGDASGSAVSIFNSYLGTNSATVSSGDKDVTINDSEVGNTSYAFNQYQPMYTEQYLLNPVNFVSTSKPTSYSSPADLSIDGEILSVGDRVLVTGASPGIYTVNSLTYGSSIGWSAAQTLSGQSLVYVRDGAVGSGKYYLWNGTSWSEAIGIPKYKVYSVKGNPIFIDSYSTKEA
jgi:hypothetical protein